MRTAGARESGVDDVAQALAHQEVPDLVGRARGAPPARRRPRLLHAGAALAVAQADGAARRRHVAPPTAPRPCRTSDSTPPHIARNPPRRTALLRSTDHQHTPAGPRDPTQPNSVTRACAACRQFVLGPKGRNTRGPPRKANLPTLSAPAARPAARRKASAPRDGPGSQPRRRSRSCAAPSPPPPPDLVRYRRTRLRRPPELPGGQRPGREGRRHRAG
ncbi:hypothetical protein PVAP13_7NG238217 [Panicum virgatum]|uniref:Uncharacterized protein n=1 Tax=Panicum virgatum TaxID=38727 RepID=A0A8T0Q128_PANVG|nr:hypothetical protein PVAP13_7NG238217 [Panicum virgatum]